MLKFMSTTASRPSPARRAGEGGRKAAVRPVGGEAMVPANQNCRMVPGATGNDSVGIRPAGAHGVTRPTGPNIAQRREVPGGFGLPKLNLPRPGDYIQLTP